MMWQDILLMVGGFIFSLALIPSILSKDKPAISTSLMTGVILLVYAFTYFTLNLWLATIAVTLTGVLWLVLAAQKVREK